MRAEGFPEEVVQAVDGVTRRDGESYLEFCRRAGHHPIAKRVKLADLTDNSDLSRIAEPTKVDFDRIEKYRKAKLTLLGKDKLPSAPSPRDGLMQSQLEWARSRGLHPDAKGYLDASDQNFFQPVSPEAKASLKQGSGNELKARKGERAKIQAVHSSAALGLNVFDFWAVTEDRSPLQRALDLPVPIASIEFERQFPMGLGGTPPNLDVVLTLADGRLVALESKFTEWMSPRSRTKRPFSRSYFPAGRELWGEVGLQRCQRLACDLRNGDWSAWYLDAPQLLKHALGLACNGERSFELWYLYFDAPGSVSDAHAEEIDGFRSRVGGEVNFRALKYQDLYKALPDDREGHTAYRQYLRSRYFG